MTLARHGNRWCALVAWLIILGLTTHAQAYETYAMEDVEAAYLCYAHSLNLTPLRGMRTAPKPHRIVALWTDHLLMISDDDGVHWDYAVPLGGWDASEETPAIIDAVFQPDGTLVAIFEGLVVGQRDATSGQWSFRTMSVPLDRWHLRNARSWSKVSLLSRGGLIIAPFADPLISQDAGTSWLALSTTLTGASHDLFESMHWGAPTLRLQDDRHMQRVQVTPEQDCSDQAPTMLRGVTVTTLTPDAIVSEQTYSLGALQPYLGCVDAIAMGHRDWTYLMHTCDGEGQDDTGVIDHVAVKDQRVHKITGEHWQHNIVPAKLQVVPWRGGTMAWQDRHIFILDGAHATPLKKVPPWADPTRHSLHVDDRGRPWILGHERLWRFSHRDGPLQIIDCRTP